MPKHTTTRWYLLRCDPVFKGEGGISSGRTIEVTIPEGETWGDAGADGRMVEKAPELVKLLRRLTGTPQPCTADLIEAAKLLNYIEED